MMILLRRRSVPALLPFCITLWICCFQVVTVASSSSSSSLFVLLDHQPQSGPGTSASTTSTSSSIRIPSTPLPTTAVITSPGTKGCYYDLDDIVVLACDDANNCLICRGAQLGGTSEVERIALATTSLIARVVLVDGITKKGDVPDFINSRHARTLTALFRARLQLLENDAEDEQEQQQDPQQAADGPQTLLLGVQGDLEDDDEEEEEEERKKFILGAVQMLFEATAMEKKNSKSFQDLYNIKIVNVETKELAKQALEEAVALQSDASPPTTTMILPLSVAYSRVLQSRMSTKALDTPHMANEWVKVFDARQKCSRALRAKVAAMESRVSRGLWIDGFGAQVHALLEQRILGAFDSETQSGAGLPLVAPYRNNIRRQLKNYVDTAVVELFDKQMENLRKSTLKRFTKQLVQNNLRTSAASSLDGDSTSSLDSVSEQAAIAADLNAATLRKEAFYFETVAEELQVPALGLTKQKVVREMASLLNDALQNFADSPAAKIARTKRTTDKVANKQQGKSGQQQKDKQPSFDIGLDLVAVFRPDGFGSLQGFCGYQWRGNSLTVGVHNDADDPQVIAQFGGVRPPLLRVQPKLRVDVEL